jgi:hypothetical protein
MSIKEKLRKIQQNSFVVISEFVLVSFVFILFVSICLWASQSPGDMMVGTVLWTTPEIVPPAIFESLGLIWYTTGVSFIKVLTIVSIIYTIIVSIMIIVALYIAALKIRETDRI